MKRIIPVCLIAALFISLLCACVNNEPGSNSAVVSESSAPSVPSSAKIAEAPDIPSGVESSAGTESAPSTETAREEATPEAVIIVESSNAISDSENQEVLNDLAEEIDSVMGDIDNMEDLDDSDLGTDDIE